eukprot:TRINITY_DN68664_c0_g1_i1.p1 TRINITY_DN68664_c0_g1~~TRINITY_DN68664_c0_g1_i1.p1  ORF type:complete len:292 (-),score=61.08 TRINITY_DN68664_c0_g1_i1:44-919(-)
MVAVEDVLTDSLATCVRSWFEPSLNHPFLTLETISVPDSLKPIPKQWVDDVEVQIDEGFGAEDGDILGEGPPKSWTLEEGRRRLREALTRLDLAEDRMAHPQLVRMNRYELSVEKRRVKQELKRYDSEFRKSYSRLPNHYEKEPLRPLYVYYRRLKTMIAQAELKQGGRRSSQGGGGSDDELIGSRIRESLPIIHDTEETPRDNPRPANRRTASAKDTMAGLEARIESLQSEKGAVRAKLQSFQEKFVQENNRKIRFHKDILPIEREYRAYKHLKDEINKAEAQLRDLKNE